MTNGASGNPFLGYGKIVLAERLVGRTRELDSLTERLYQRAGSLSIIGTHRIGKSSLVTEAVRRAKVNYHVSPIIMVSLSVIDNSKSLFETILEEVRVQAEDDGLELPPKFYREIGKDATDSYEAYRRLKRGMIALCKADIKTAVVLDEFDAIRGFLDADKTIQRLRDLIDHWHETGSCMVFISRRSLYAIEKQLYGVSNLDNVCEKQYVLPLESDGLAQMTARLGNCWKLTPEEVKTLMWHTGGHPFLSEMILCRSWEDRHLVTGIGKSIGDMYDYYGHLRELLIEDTLFDQMVQATVGPRWSLKLESIDNLTRYGLIKCMKSPSATFFQAWSEHFQIYLEKCSREAPTWELWRTTELALRDFIESRCQEALGANWHDVLGKRHPKSVGAIFDGCQERMAKDKKLFGLNASERLLDYAYPMQLWEIISAAWENFNSSFKREKNYWKERFALLAKVRTPYAHSRDFVIPEHEITNAQGYCQEILSVIK